MLKFLLLVLCSFPVFAGNLYNDVPPITKHPVDQVVTNEMMTIGYSYSFREPLYSAEKLTADEVAASKLIGRHNSFHEDEAIPEEYRATKYDFRNTGESKCHLTPANDAPTYEQQVLTFSLANMMPCIQAMNGGVWKNIEEHTQSLASEYKTAYVVTGSLWTGGFKYVHKKNGKKLNNPLTIPDAQYKGVLLPSQKIACVYVAPTDASKTYQIMDVKEFYKETGVNPFPNIDYHCTENVYKISMKYILK